MTSTVSLRVAAVYVFGEGVAAGRAIHAVQQREQRPGQ
jgi:hypothetical protein